MPRADTRREFAAAHDPGGDLGRHRRGGGGRVPSAAGPARGGAVSGRSGVATPGPPAGLLRRQHHRAAGRRFVRRLPGAGQTGAGRCAPAAERAAEFGQQHQPGPAAAADGLLRARIEAAFRSVRSPAELRHPDRQPRQHRGRDHGAGAGRAAGADRAGHQRQRRASTIFRGRRVPARPQRRHAGQCDGRRRAQQFRAPAVAVRDGYRRAARCIHCNTGD